MIAAKPHEGHFAIRSLGSELGKSVTVITQNVDEMHQRSWISKRSVIEGMYFWDL